MLQKTDIIRILTDLNYPYKDMGGYVLTKGIYRGGQTLGSIAIYNNGLAVDFVEGSRHTLVDFVSLCTGLKGEEVKEWFVNRVDLSTLNEISKPLIKEAKTYPKTMLNSILPIHDYFIGRGVGKDTLSLFKGGLVKTGQMQNRYTFPIFDSKENIIGFAGRDVTNKSSIKWKLIGDKSYWIYPFFLNLDVIKKKKEVIIVESMGDGLSLWESDVKNILITFGTSLGKERLKALIKINPERIIIALNQDVDKEENWGQEAAEKMKATLLKFFDSSQVEIKPPTKNDFGEMTQEENKQWYGN